MKPVWTTWSESRRFGEPDPFERELGATFLAWIFHELWGRPATVLDVGTGRGKVALEIAPRAREVVGLDIDAEAIAEAAALAQRHALRQARFAVADCETADLLEASGLRNPADLITMHLCVSEPMIHRAAQALRPGGALVGVAHEASRWNETGMPSRFAATTDQLGEALGHAGLAIEQGRIETSVMHFQDAAECERYLRDGHHLLPWQRNGRWESWKKRLAAKPRAPIALTRSHLVFLARRGV